MRMSCPGTVAVAAFSLVAFLPAQARPAPAPVPRPDGQGTITVSGQYVFVLRGDVLYQFDIDTLALRHHFRFPAGGPAAPAAKPAPAPVEVPVVDTEVAEPPPPPPPEGPAAPAPAAVTASIGNALLWLARHQDEDGKWDCDNFMKHDRDGTPCTGPGNAVHDVGVTSLALLAFLGNGHTMRRGDHRDQVKKAAVWLKDQQQENGLFGTNASHDFIYDHAVATFAISEAFGLSNYQLLKPIAQKGINYLESHRNPFAVWRYQPRDNDNDTSVTTWAALALVSGNFFGLQVNQQSLNLVGVWYDQVTGPDGRAGYTKQGEPSSRMPGDHATRFPPQNGEAMTAAATLGRLFLGQTPKDKPVLARSAAVLAAKPPRWQPGHVDAVYWYFGTYAAFQLGGPTWDVWHASLGDLVQNQEAAGNAAGSWDPIGVWDETGGRVFVTALYTLTLEASARQAKLKK